MSRAILSTRALVGTAVTVLAIGLLSSVAGPATAAAAPSDTACSEQADADGLVPVLQLDVPVSAAWSGQTPPYTFDDTAAVAGGVDRVGYCLETTAGGAEQWAWTAMEAFTDDPSQLGLHTRPGDVTRQRVDDLTVDSNVAGVPTGSDLTGYLEMWPNSYERANTRQVAHASGTAYDADDSPTPGGYGSFQVHAVGDQPDSATQPTTVFAVNHFTDTGDVPLDIGIGNGPAEPDWTFRQNAGSYTERTFTVYARPAQVEITAEPEDRQLYPRDSDDGADVTVAGEVTDPAVDAVRLTVTSQGDSDVQEQTGDTFAFDTRIEAGLHDYDLTLETVSGDTTRTVGHWTHVVSGDAYLIQGQSNAQAAPLVSGGSTVAESPFIRSYGTNAFAPDLSAANRAWNYATGDLLFNQAAVGQWGLEMARDLVRTEEVPIAIINGAHGGAAIGFLQRDDANPDNIDTNYGRARQRLVGSGLMDDLTGVLWYQGETEGENVTAHIAGFRSLLADWRGDLQGARGDDPLYYVFQVRTTGCGSVAGAALREGQRQLGFTDGVTVLSTTAVPGHDGCHFSWPGHRLLGDQVADTLRRDLFGGPSDGVAAPNPLSAEFTTRQGDAIVVQLASATDELDVDAGVGADFRLVGSDATVTGIEYLSGGRLELSLSRPAPEATGLTYLGRIGDGPVITTSRRVGLLAFDDLPIANPSAQHRALQRILDRLADLDTRAAELHAAGDLTTAQREHVAASTAQAADAVSAALAAADAGERAAELEHLLAAGVVVDDLRAWVDQTGASGPVLGLLRSRVADVQQRLGNVTATAFGITVTAVPLEAPVAPGQSVPGTLRVDAAAAGLTDVAAQIAVGNWDVDDSTAEVATIAPGGSADLAFEATVPVLEAPGPVPVSAAVTFTTADDTFTLHTTTPWASVNARLSVENPVTQQVAGDPAERILLTADVVNDGDRTVTGQLVVDGPNGWPTPALSAQVTVEPGQRLAVTVPITVPLDVVAGSHDVPVTFVRGDVAVAATTAPVGVGLPTPPTAEVFDHVDFGNAASESAHDVLGSATSGTNVEAGLTRRYSHSAFPGSWYSVEVDVPAGEPFVVRNIETFDGARTKKYDVFVDGTRVKTQLVPRTESGQGTKVYDLLVDDPAVLAADGSVRLRFEFPVDAAGFSDPSIADLWVLGLSDDTAAPDVSASVRSERPGGLGWQRGPATVTVHAVDNRDPVPTVAFGRNAGWHAYTAPVTIAGEGRHLLSFRATDAAGNRSKGSVPVWIDTSTPSTTVDVRQQPGASERVTLEFTATDRLSGVDRTSYRIDGGKWAEVGPDGVEVSDEGAHRIEYFSTDVAGNDEAVGRVRVTLPAATDPLTTAASSTGLQVSRTTVPAGTSVKVTAAVVAAGTRPTGKVALVVDGRTVQTVRLRDGKAVGALRVRAGRHRVTVRYLGSATVAGSSSPIRIVKGK